MELENIVANTVLLKAREGKDGDGGADSSRRNRVGARTSETTVAVSSEAKATRGPVATLFISTSSSRADARTEAVTGLKHVANFGPNRVRFGLCVPCPTDTEPAPQILGKEAGSGFDNDA